ncbi:Uncharacterised protein [Mycobacterium tuberculosis]|nr:Uncharacterised protein [Mycobacterium tuberculosis]CLW11479.1 Uncharacterised protein [Mycobacterium tuberculosis]CLY31077.1 Uncharacterised protein [Mycobacterium tuberculosis]
MRSSSSVSSDPKPREGTETQPHRLLGETCSPRVVRPKTPRGDGNRFASDRFASIKSGRQTQNPERGRKLYHSRPNRYRRVQVVRPKTPRGDGNILSANSSTVPLSGRQTQNPERGRKRPVDGGCVVRASVVRPKTPRGDGNPTMASKSAWVTDPGRQTQNPERGRKLVRHLCLIQVQCPVVRPKTPRGDGNLTARSFPASIR